MKKTVRTGGNQFAHFFRFPATHSDSELAKLQWLVRLRWLAITLFFVLSAPALVAKLLSRETMPMFLGVVGVLFIFNLLTQLMVSEQKRAISPLWICFQMAFDLGMLTILLALTGGFSNPFIVLYLLNASLGGILIASRLSLPFLLLTHAFMGLLQFQYFIANQSESGPRLFATFALYHFLILAFWLVMRSLGGHLERQFERHTQAQMLLEKRDRLRAIGALAAGFSHEFASPLNSAKIRLERIARRDHSEDATEALDAVRACEIVVHHMNSSQLDARDFQFKDIVVADLLKDIVKTWEAGHPETKVRMQIRDTSLGAVPPINFAQVVLNLLDNASEAAPKSEIEVELTATETTFLLSFSDHGPGFPDSVLKRLGEPFVTTKANGTGLGLYVAELFSQSLGGSLQFANRKNGFGATVRLEWSKSGGRA